MEATKTSKDEEKRLLSILEKRKGYLKQKSAIQSALAKVDTNQKNKIVFADSENESDNEEENYPPENGITQNSLIQNDLFDGSEDEGASYNFEVKNHFEGKKGQELFKLQSRYKKDNRFTLDERFYNEDDDVDENIENVVIEDEISAEITSKEKQNELTILEEVLGKKIKSISDSNLKPKSMSRFDPSQPEHCKFEIKKSIVGESKIKKKLKRKLQETTNDVPIVSEEKFYKITEDIKDVLQTKEAFSLLDMFNEQHTIEDSQEISELPQEPIARRKLNKENPFVYDSSEEESGSETQNQEDTCNHEDQNEQKSYVDLGPSKLWSEPFFFRDYDHRLQEGLEFFKKKGVCNEQDFVQVRRNLKETVKAKVRNNHRKYKPFQKKLGGTKKTKY